MVTLNLKTDPQTTEHSSILSSVASSSTKPTSLHAEEFDEEAEI
jgi:hypothetical protein